MRIWGSLPGEKAASDLKKRLNDYGVNADQHIVANTTDAASGKAVPMLNYYLLGIIELCPATFL